MARSLVASRNGYGGVSQAFLELPGEEPSSVEDPDLDDVPSMFDVVHIAQEYVWRELAALVLKERISSFRSTLARQGSTGGSSDNQDTWLGVVENRG